MACGESRANSSKHTNKRLHLSSLPFILSMLCSDTGLRQCFFWLFLHKFLGIFSLARPSPDWLIFIFNDHYSQVDGIQLWLGDVINPSMPCE